MTINPTYQKQNQTQQQKTRNPSVQLALNGKPVYLHNIQMRVSVKREEKDMSGQKSSTKKSDKGVKAKELNVTGEIPYKQKQWLTDLFKLAESESQKGEQTKYRVSAIIAEAVNMREVQFSDSVHADEQIGKMAWVVSFTLREASSVAEKKSKRNKKPTAKVQTSASTANSASVSTGASASSSSDTEKSGWAKDLDDFLGKLEER